MISFLVNFFADERRRYSLSPSESGSRDDTSGTILQQRRIAITGKPRSLDDNCILLFLRKQLLNPTINDPFPPEDTVAGDPVP